MALQDPQEVSRHFRVEGELALEYVRKALEAGKRFDDMSQPLLAKALREQTYRNRIMRVVADELARLLVAFHLEGNPGMYNLADGEYCRSECDACQAFKIWRGLLK